MILSRMHFERLSNEIGRRIGRYHKGVLFLFLSTTVLFFFRGVKERGGVWFGSVRVQPLFTTLPIYLLDYLVHISPTRAEQIKHV